MKPGKEIKMAGKKESSSAYFERLRPKFLDWKPPTDEEKALAVRARREAKEAELKRVTDLEREQRGRRKEATQKSPMFAFGRGYRTLKRQ